MHPVNAARPKPDRRRPSRVVLPDCGPSCGQPAGRVVVRTARSLYVQCDRCHRVQCVTIGAPGPLKTGRRE
jgi:hypothetical protein